MQASSTMVRDVIVVPPELTLAGAWRVMSREKIRHLPVVRAGALIGMLSERDVLTRGKLDEGVFHVPAGVIVADAMTETPLETCEPSTDVREIARVMVEKKIDAMPVTKGLRLLGLVTSSDLLSLLVRQGDGQPLPFEYRLIDDSHAYT